MSVWPVIERELRAEARHAFTYWLRALSASVSLIIFAVMMIEPGGNASALGAKLFGKGKDPMSVWPVIERELRAEARHAFTYWLRALSASVSLIIFAVMT